MSSRDHVLLSGTNYIVTNNLCLLCFIDKEQLHMYNE